jgi:flagellum-specific peptidoglycan hydrolase FlgJ
MSYSKSFSHFDDEQHGIIPGHQRGQRKSKPGQKKRSFHPVKSYFNQNEMSTKDLIGYLLARLRPAWLSLRFRWQLLGQAKNGIQLGILIVLGYFVLSIGQTSVGVGHTDEEAAGASIMEQNEPRGKAKKTRYKNPNEAAPVSGSELFKQEAESYIEQFSSIARQEQAKYGVPASISLAQGLIESRAGTSKLAVNNNNHFGIKCFSRKCRKGHCSNFTDDTHKDFFRKFPNAWESWREHSQMLSRGRYAKLKKHGTDYRKWAYGLKSIGYATDRTYAEKLIGVIERYDLHRFD